jgi:hypothetical protein
MKRDYEKVILVIRHLKNKEEHLNSIFHLISNFNAKWKCLSVDDSYIQLYLSEMITEFNKLKNDLNKQ